MLYASLIYLFHHVNRSEEEKTIWLVCESTDKIHHFLIKKKIQHLGCTGSLEE